MLINTKKCFSKYRLKLLTILRTSLCLIWLYQVYSCSVWFYWCSLLLSVSLIPGDFCWEIPSQLFCAGGFWLGNAPYQEWNGTSLVRENLGALRGRLFNGMYVLHSCTKIHLLLLNITRQLWLIKNFECNIRVKVRKKINFRMIKCRIW